MNNLDHQKSKYHFNKITFFLNVLFIVIITLLIGIENTRIPFLISLISLALITVSVIYPSLLILFLFLSILLPFSVTLGTWIIKPADLLILLGTIIILNEALWCKTQFKLFPIPYQKFIFTFVLTCILSLINAKYIGEGLKDIIQLFEIYILGALFFKKFLTLKVLQYIIFALFLFTIIQLPGALVALFNNVRYWGITHGNLPIIMSISSIIALHISFEKLKWRYPSYFILISSLIILLSTGTRSAWLATLFGFIVSFSLKGFKRFALFTLSIVFLIVTVNYLNLPLLTTRLSSIFDLNFRTNISRFILISSAWNAFLSHPIFGVGINNLVFQISAFLPEWLPQMPFEVWNTIHNELISGAGAHNIYLQILAETGLLGFISIITLFTKIFIDSINNYKKSFSHAQKTYNSLLMSLLVVFYFLAGFTPGIHVRIEYASILVILMILIDKEKTATLIQK